VVKGISEAQRIVKGNSRGSDDEQNLLCRQETDTFTHRKTPCYPFPCLFPLHSPCYHLLSQVEVSLLKPAEVSLERKQGADAVDSRW
jgi:hypothetical protein